MTLNGAVALILLFSPNLTALPANCVTVVEDRTIMSPEYRIPVPVFHFWPKLTHTAAIAELLVHLVFADVSYAV